MSNIKISNQDGLVKIEGLTLYLEEDTFNFIEKEAKRMAKVHNEEYSLSQFRTTLNVMIQCQMVSAMKEFEK